MDNLIIIGVLVIVAVIGLKSTIKHFKGEGSCCGGGTYQAKSKKLQSVAEKTVYRVDGMHCQHCVNRVMEAVQDIPGASASVNLKKGTVTVSMEQHIEDSVIKQAIEKHGYQVLGTN